MRTFLSFLVCLLLASEAQAVRLMDGAEVGQMFGYVAACVRNVGMNPPGTAEDKRMGEKYGTWLIDNGANVNRVLNDLQTNTGIGMAAAVRSNYSNCEGALREMIGFYEFFKLKGTSYYPILERYTSKNTPAVIRENDPITANERDDFLAFDREQQMKEVREPELPLGQLGLKDDYTTATMKLRYNSDSDLMMMIKSTSSSNVDCSFEGMCDVENGVVLVCTQFVDGKEMVVVGEFDDTGIELLPSSTKSVCPKGGVLDGTYVMK